MAQKIAPTNIEIPLRADDFIVSKTDNIGRLTYCNNIFMAISGYSEQELLGQQHNIVRHPDMPRAVFHMLWSTVRSGDEFLGYVKNLSKNGCYYWVFATVTPSYKPNTKEIIGFFSVRRKPDAAKLRIIESLYKDMLAAEKRVNQRDAIAAGTAVLNDLIRPTGKDYCEFILTL